MSKQRFETILAKILYIENHKEEFDNPDLIINWLENLILTIE